LNRSKLCLAALVIVVVLMAIGSYTTFRVQGTQVWRKMLENVEIFHPRPMMVVLATFEVSIRYRGPKEPQTTSVYRIPEEGGIRRDFNFSDVMLACSEDAAAIPRKSDGGDVDQRTGLLDYEFRENVDVSSVYILLRVRDVDASSTVQSSRRPIRWISTNDAGDGFFGITETCELIWTSSRTMSTEKIN
jgi:hypothetical protein